jgi:hypothetical protein
MAKARKAAEFPVNDKNEPLYLDGETKVLYFDHFFCGISRQQGAKPTPVISTAVTVKKLIRSKIPMEQELVDSLNGGAGYTQVMDDGEFTTSMYFPHGKAKENDVFKANDTYREITMPDPDGDDMLVKATDGLGNYLITGLEVHLDKKGYISDEGKRKFTKPESKETKTKAFSKPI